MPDDVGVEMMIGMSEKTIFGAPPIRHRYANGALVRKSRRRGIGNFSFIYVAALDGDDVIKVGFSTNPAARMADLCGETKRIIRLRWTAKTCGRDARKIEKAFHTKFKPQPCNAVGEWYLMSGETAITALIKFAEELGVAIEYKTSVETLLTEDKREERSVTGAMSRMDDRRFAIGNAPHLKQPLLQHPRLAWPRTKPLF